MTSKKLQKNAFSASIMEHLNTGPPQVLCENVYSDKLQKYWSHKELLYM